MDFPRPIIMENTHQSVACEVVLIGLVASQFTLKPLEDVRSIQFFRCQEQPAVLGPLPTTGAATPGRERYREEKAADDRRKPPNQSRHREGQQRCPEHGHQRAGPMTAQSLAETCG